MNASHLLRFVSLSAPLAALSLAAALSVSRPASAHTLLVNPPPVTNNDGAKSGPCGCEFGGDPACPASWPKTKLIAGEAFIVQWKETVNHPGKFRLAFAPKAVDQVTSADLDANVLYDKDDTNNIKDATLTATIVIPDTPCTACTLQLRQFMSDSMSSYYSCASVEILPPGGGEGGAGGAGSSTGTSSGPTGGMGGAGQGGEMEGEDDSTGPGLAVKLPPIQGGSCSFGGEPAGGLWVFAALGAAAALLRRRG